MIDSQIVSCINIKERNYCHTKRDFFMAPRQRKHQVSLFVWCLKPDCYFGSETSLDESVGDVFPFLSVSTEVTTFSMAWATIFSWENRLA